MSFLPPWTRGAGQPTYNEEEVVEKLRDRLDTSEKLSDRRAYILSLKNFAHGSGGGQRTLRTDSESRVWLELQLVGKKSLNALIKALHTDYEDKDLYSMRY